MLEALEERQVPSTLTVTSSLASGPGSLPTILDQANTDASAGKSDTITFAAGLKNKTIRLQASLSVPAGNGTVTINGANHISISGGNQYRLFQVASGGHLTLKNLTLEHGFYTGNPIYLYTGGAIYNEGSLTLIGCNVRNNRESYRGGAIANGAAAGSVSGGTLTARNCTFDLNSTDAAGGGAMDNYLATVTLIGCKFDSNTARSFGIGEGGAIRSDQSTLTVTGCTFNFNSAYDGGAIYSTQGTTSVANSTFFENAAPDEGGAIWTTGGLTMSGCTFSTNWAGNGGAILNFSGSSMSASRCTFSGNDAIDNGAGVYNQGTLMLTGCSFSANSASNGGAIFNDVSATISAFSCTFFGNDADSGGAGVSNQGTLTLTGCTFNSNSAEDGGAIDNSGTGTLTLKACRFRLNSASYGGAIFEGLLASLTLSHCTFNGNLASAAGKNIYYVVFVVPF
jgi:predicted outer membrane repeat protein